MKDWKSGSPDLLVPMSDWGYYGKQNTEKPFTPGVYLVEYNKLTNTVTLSK